MYFLCLLHPLMCLCVCVCPCVRRSVQFAAGREQQRCHLQFLEIRPHHSPLPPQRHAAIRQGRVRTQHMCLHAQVCRSSHVCVVWLRFVIFDSSGPVWAADGAAALRVGAAVLEGDGVQHARTQQTGMTHLASVPQHRILFPASPVFAPALPPPPFFFI